jgi:hypothetical protein
MITGDKKMGVPKDAFYRIKGRSEKHFPYWTVSNAANCPLQEWWQKNNCHKEPVARSIKKKNVAG